MEIILKEKPKSPVIISGFPGVGMVGSIATEFLLQHLGTKKIGSIIVDKAPPLVAIHGGEIVEPFGIYYSKRHNIVVAHSIVAIPGSEWQISKALLEIAKTLGAKEIVSVEGVGSNTEISKARTLYFTNTKTKEKGLEKQKMQKLNEGIIMGPTSALLVKAGKFPITCFFAETHSKLPDSNAAAGIVKALDSYLGLKVDYKPLQKLATEFENKLKGIMSQSKKAEELRDKKQMNYVG
jgi:uncharacterized protein